MKNLFDNLTAADFYREPFIIILKNMISCFQMMLQDLGNHPEPKWKLQHFANTLSADARFFSAIMIELETSWILIQSFFCRCILLNFFIFVFHSIFVKILSFEVFSTFCLTVFLEQKWTHEATRPKMLLKSFEASFWLI